MTILEKYRPLWAPEGASGGSSAPAGASGGGGGPASSAAPAPSSAPSSPSGSPASRGTSAPAESPASATEAQPSSPSSDGDLSFETIFGPEGSPSFEGEAPPSIPPTVPPPTVQPPAAAAPVAEVKPAAAAQPGAVEAQAAPGASPPPAPSVQLDPYNPGQLAQHLLSVEAQATDFVAQQMFALTPEDREAIETDVIGTIPKLLARVFVKSQQNVLQQLDRLIPTMVQRHTDAMRRNMEGESKFYARWPDIGREHANVVNQLAVAYRQMHPNATLDQMIEDVGPFVMMAARIAPSSAGAPGQGQPVRPAQSGANGRPPQPAPFVPAGSGSGPASQPKTQELTPWEAMFVGRDS